MTLRKLAVPPVLVGIIGITGYVGIKARGRRGRRPTAEQLMKMSDADFAKWIKRTGLKTVTTAGLAPIEVTAD